MGFSVYHNTNTLNKTHFRKWFFLPIRGFFCIVLRVTQKTAIEYLRDVVREHVDREGLRPFASSKDIPVGQVRGLLSGDAPLSTTIEAACEALDLEFYIGPPRSEPTAVEEAQSQPPPWASELRDGFRELWKELRANPWAPLRESDPRQELSPAPEEGEEYEVGRRYPDVRLAAGSEAIVDREDLVEPLSIPTEWLQAHGLDARNVCLVNVWGDSMAPTLYDGDGVFVDFSHNRPLSGRVYALRTSDGMVVKRLRKRQGRWWADSDNPEVKPRAIEEGDEVIGEIVWAGRELGEARCRLNGPPLR